MLPAFLPHPVDLAARAFNALTAQEAWAREKLVRHAGKRIMLIGLGWRAGFLVASDACLEPLDADEGGRFDVTLTLPEDILTLPRPGAVLPPLAERMHIAGDVGLAQTLAALAQGLRWDVEDTLARWIGDIPAVRLVGVARQTGDGLQRLLARLAGNTAEYLAEEAQVVLGTSACQQWQQDHQAVEQQLATVTQRVLGLRRRLDRLETAAGQGVRS